MTHRPRSHFAQDGPQEDACPHLPVEQGPDGRGVGSWVPARKHMLLAEYLHSTRKAWASPHWRHRVYIDPFCSWGRARVDGEPFTRDGGAVVAWRESVASGAPFTHVFVGDIDPDRADGCAQRLRALGAPVRAFHGPASLTVPDMAAAVPGQALTLAFLDPYSLGLLTLDLFQALQRLRADVAAHFSVYDLVRNCEMELDPGRDRFEAVAPGWRQSPHVLGRSAANTRLAFFHFWRLQVEGLGWSSSGEVPLIHNDSGAPLYRLVFFAHHELPLRVWADIARAQSLQRPLL